MDKRHLFYRYYDVLFSSKNYGAEVSAVVEYCRTSGLQPLAHILEIGCGTGNHTLEFAKMSGVHVTAIDTDPQMLALAQSKVALAGTTDVTFASGIGGERNIDLTVALFNVVNYIIGDENLRELFAAIAASLRAQGMFIFDCWNGTAALLDPPGSKSYEQQSGGELVRCRLTSRTDFDRKVTTMDYQLDLLDEAGDKIESGDYLLEHRLWTPGEIKAALGEAGLEVVTVCIPFKFEQAATDIDWKIMFVCRKR
jgi:SAM-dependent methyltransferase